MRAIAAGILACMLMAAMPIGAVAQQSGDDEGQQIRTLPPAYDDHMLRLSEILGALHYLRALCGADEGQRWRQEMDALLKEEDPDTVRRARLIARFNRGFRGFREVYRECTPAAAEAANRYRRQGIRLAAEIPERFGD